MKINIFILIILLILAFLLGQNYDNVDNPISQKATEIFNKDPIVGCWETSQIGFKTVLKFESDGTLIRQTTSEGIQIWNYELDNETITAIKPDGSEFTKPYKVVPNKALQIGEDAFVKCGDSQVEPNNPFS